MKKIGFTLAEVIVTLAIIGVITALVLPQFISRTHNQANASKLSTIITDYENIFGMMLVKENKNDIFETEFGKAWTGNNQAGMKTAMEKYSKIARSSENNNTRSLGYMSYLMDNITPAASATDGGPCAGFIAEYGTDHLNDPVFVNGTYGIHITQECCESLGYHWFPPNINYTSGRCSVCPQGAEHYYRYPQPDSPYECHQCQQGAPFFYNGGCNNCPADYPQPAGHSGCSHYSGVGAGGCIEVYAGNGPYGRLNTCLKCHPQQYWYALDGAAGACHTCHWSSPYHYNNKCNQCPQGKTYKYSQPSSGWSCVHRSPGSGFCCVPSNPCDDNECAPGCPGQGTQACCEQNWDGTKCCDDAHYYGNPQTCHRCPSSKPHIDSDGKCCDDAHFYNGKCNKNPNPCADNPNSKECCATKEDYTYDGAHGLCCPTATYNSNNNSCVSPEPPTNSCDDDPNSEACCVSQNYHWYQNSCCETSGGNWDGSQCCDSEHYYGEACHQCPNGYEHKTFQPLSGWICTGSLGNYCCTQEPPLPPNVTLTPFSKFTKQRATTEDIKFSYAGTDSAKNANILYSDIVSYDYTDAAGKTTTRKAATIYIDVNGKSGPNMFGSDVFAVVLDQDGHIYPYGSEKAAIILTGPDNAAANTWKGTTDRYGCTTKPYGGLGCTARLVENNFKVDY